MSIPNRTIKAIVFDVGKVLIQWDMRVLFAKLIRDPQELDWFLANVVTEDWHFEHDAGRELEDMLEEKKLQFPDYACQIDAYATRFLETIPGHIPGTHELVERLAARGVPLYALTNFAAPFWAEFQPTEPIFDHFREIVVSGQEKMAKPDPAIYALAEKRFGHAGHELLFIDDNPANVQSARDCGWNTHHFRDAKGLEIDLQKQGLLD
ncbi:HAD family phosphatase [Altericroceibacterium spongiae]|uniref:HAD family phosphatase n=1 Tax=Altericroceibacterium spongiae TaxID=2320269 RepID=A0A420EM25_9SPHN|nr:HAD family phosphatase [Altericroceibacterium spongiae]RKF21741.1 HAD family phosphatase [Altericroceibacterium spongiae]